MNSSTITQSVSETFEGVTIDDSTTDTFFFTDPQLKFPFATIVTRDNDFDNLSQLNRPDVFRLNIGIGKASFRALFGDLEPAEELDFTKLDQLMPHPIYGRMFWVCVLNPSEATFQSVLPLLREAYELSRQKYA